MSSNLDAAKAQSMRISAAINGSSSALQTLGSMGSDPHPERLLAVGLAHAQNSIGALIKAVESLEAEVAHLRAEAARKRR
jgi:hypothetical protein